MCSSSGTVLSFLRSPCAPALSRAILMVHACGVRCECPSSARLHVVRHPPISRSLVEWYAAAGRLPWPRCSTSRLTASESVFCHAGISLH